MEFAAEDEESSKTPTSTTTFTSTTTEEISTDLTDTTFEEDSEEESSEESSIDITKLLENVTKKEGYRVISHLKREVDFIKQLQKKLIKEYGEELVKQINRLDQLRLNKEELSQRLRSELEAEKEFKQQIKSLKTQIESFNEQILIDSRKINKLEFKESTTIDKLQDLESKQNLTQQKAMLKMRSLNEKISEMNKEKSLYEKEIFLMKNKSIDYEKIISESNIESRLINLEIMRIDRAIIDSDSELIVWEEMKKNSENDLLLTNNKISKILTQIRIEKHVLDIELDSKEAQLAENKITLNVSAIATGIISNSKERTENIYFDCQKIIGDLESEIVDINKTIEENHQRSLDLTSTILALRRCNEEKEKEKEQEQEQEIELEED